MGGRTASCVDNFILCSSPAGEGKGVAVVVIAGGSSLSLCDFIHHRHLATLG